ncbi:uncharacterized protein LOC142559098 isoform X1 [Dermacentor variabilis]|uniref:uncharacterized protein LOC142559098 isoform X1 n=1 Tax=Dermacentor variabilis TaxID=34621 RepID=UPI003F5BAB76
MRCRFFNNYNGIMMTIQQCCLPCIALLICIGCVTSASGLTHASSLPVTSCVPAAPPLPAIPPAPIVLPVPVAPLLLTASPAPATLAPHEFQSQVLWLLNIVRLTVQEILSNLDACVAQGKVTSAPAVLVQQPFETVDALLNFEASLGPEDANVLLLSGGTSHKVQGMMLSQPLSHGFVILLRGLMKDRELDTSEGEVKMAAFECWLHCFNVFPTLTCGNLIHVIVAHMLSSPKCSASAKMYQPACSSKYQVFLLYSFRRLRCKFLIWLHLSWYLFRSRHIEHVNYKSYLSQH